MAIQVRRGNEVDFDPSRMLPGEWAVSLDSKYVRMCFSPGVCLRMATYEAFEADMEQITGILAEAKTVEEAIQKIYDNVQQAVIDVELASKSVQTAIEKAEEAENYAVSANESATKAENASNNAQQSAITSSEKAAVASASADSAKMSETYASASAATSTQKADEALASSNSASDSEKNAKDYSDTSKSYAVGGTDTRENEDSDNAKYYYQQSKQISQGFNGIIPMGTVTFANLPTEDIVKNAMYNISDAFTSDERFNDGGGVYYGPGNNVVYTAEGKWDVTASSAVTGIKGANEDTYRQGNVNITPKNIGAVGIGNDNILEDYFRSNDYPYTDTLGTEHTCRNEFGENQITSRITISDTSNITEGVSLTNGRIEFDKYYSQILSYFKSQGYYSTTSNFNIFLNYDLLRGDTDPYYIFSDSAFYVVSEFIQDLGRSSYKWSNIYATNGTIQTSDRNEKNTIADMTAEQAEALIYGLKPSTYQMNSGTSGRTHWGMISQDIEELFESLGWTSLDFAGFIKSPKSVMEKTVDESGKVQHTERVIEGEYTYSLRYDEFIAPLIKVVQEQKAKIDSLEESLAKQNARISALEAKL